MNYSKLQWWERFQKYYAEFPTLGLAVDLSRMNVDDKFFARMEPRMQKTFSDMAALERGAIANPDENRMVGHYWLRNPALAPKPEIRSEIEDTIARIRDFAAKIHTGEIRGAGGTFKNYLLIGIGGSALGAAVCCPCFGRPANRQTEAIFFRQHRP